MKTVADLRKSRKQRAAILAAFGEVPQSILRHNTAIKAIDLQVEAGRGYNDVKNTGGHTGRLATIFDVSGQSVRASRPSNNHMSASEELAAFEFDDKLPPLSRFSQNVGRILLLLYSMEGNLVIDPFAGHNSRMELCWRNNRHYAGNDISAAFMEDNRKIAEMLRNEVATDFFPEQLYAEIRLTQGDSRNLPYADNEGDFTITSPPYWDLEYYGNEPGQLGTDKSYAEFLAGLGDVVKENYRVLVPGAFCVWVVNDFRKDGVFYSYHEDTAELLRNAGFVQHDLAIIDLGSPIRAAFAQQVIETQILPKRHEYALVFRKP